MSAPEKGTERFPGGSDWERELAAYKKEFIESQGWNEKQAANWSRDAWAYPHDGQLAISLAREDIPADALPVFQFRSPAGWKLLPAVLLQVSEKFRLQGYDLVKSLTPREQVYAKIAEQGPPGQSKESELKRELSQQAAGSLADICDRYESEPEAAEDCFWQAILAAIQLGRRQAIAEIYADEGMTAENMRGRLMTRKGQSAKGRKRPDSSLREFRKHVQDLVREGLKDGRDARTVRSFVASRLHREGMTPEVANFVLNGAIARQDTVFSWVRQEIKRLERQGV